VAVITDVDAQLDVSGIEDRVTEIAGLEKKHHVKARIDIRKKRHAKID
jgi:hypothetical protein